MNRRFRIVWFIFTVLAALVAFRAYADVSGYTFSSSLGTYTEITGGTVLGSSANDDESFNAIPLGFSFTYNGTTYEEVSVQTDGFLAFGASVLNSPAALVNPAGTNNVVCAMNRDLMSTYSGELSYLLSGTTPDRVFTVQWSNYRRTPTEAMNDMLSFQIQLHENGNQVKFCYGMIYVMDVVSARTFQVGLRGDAAADFNNRSTTTDWTATTAGIQNTATCTLTETVYPPPGLLFTFTPPPTLDVFPSSHDFGMVNVGEMVSVNIDMYASGMFPGDLTINDIYWSGDSGFNINYVYMPPHMMSTGDHIYEEVQFSPSWPGYASGNLVIVWNDTQITNVPISGSGMYPIDPLVPPTNLTATLFENTVVMIAWDAVPGATSYRIYRSLNGGESFDMLDETYNTFYEDFGAMPGYGMQLVNYRLTASNGGPETEPSEVLSVGITRISTTGVNYVGIPFDTGMQVSEWVNSQDLQFDTVSHWNASTQYWDTAIDYGGFWDNDFMLSAGMVLEVNNYGSYTWAIITSTNSLGSDYNISINPGYNLVLVPYGLDITDLNGNTSNTTAEEVASDIGPDVESVSVWDPLYMFWKQWCVEYPSYFWDGLQPCNFLFIYSAQSYTDWYVPNRSGGVK